MAESAGSAARLSDEQIARMQAEVGHARNTRWPAGDSWIRGYAEDVAALLAERDALVVEIQRKDEARYTEESSALNWIIGFCEKHEKHHTGFTHIRRRAEAALAAARGPEPEPPIYRGTFELAWLVADVLLARAARGPEEQA